MTGRGTNKKVPETAVLNCSRWTQTLFCRLNETNLFQNGDTRDWIELSEKHTFKLQANLVKNQIIKDEKFFSYLLRRQGAWGHWCQVHIPHTPIATPSIQLTPRLLEVSRLQPLAGQNLPHYGCRRVRQQLDPSFRATPGKASWPQCGCDHHEIQGPLQAEDELVGP